MDQYDPTAEGDPYAFQSHALAAWFLGPRAENSGLFNELVLESFTLHEESRRKFYPTDPEYVSAFHKATKPYKQETKQLRRKLGELNDELHQSTPIFSPRFQGHMNWDITMPAFLGYISGMLWNPNNVDVTASPVTTPYEILVGDQICDMIGFDRTNPDFQPWGHITCGGSIANIEALWSSRNLKFYAVGLQDAVNTEPKLAGGKDYMVLVPANDGPVADSTDEFISRKLSECSVWQLLNIDVDEACKMAEGVAKQAGFSDMEQFSSLVHRYTYTSRGISSFLRYIPTLSGDDVARASEIKSPQSFCPATCHYSWPKAATALGLGEDNLILVEVDRDARQKMSDLRSKLDVCVTKGIPVISVIAVMGSTEESAMDPLGEVLDIRKEYRKKGLNFCVLADAAWGCYMMTTLISENVDDGCKLAEQDNDEDKKEGKRGKRGKRGRTGKKDKKSGEKGLQRNAMVVTAVAPIIPLSGYVKEHMSKLREADTVTSDPHKTGYCPYPAGGLSYRNGTMKEFVRLAAPEVFHSEDDLSVGINGLEGSKPGAAAAGVLLSHRVIGLDKYGYGRILGQCIFGSKMFYCMWTHLAKETDPFVIAMYTPCSDEQKNKMKELIIGKSNFQIAANANAMDLLGEVGPDALINKFGMNVKKVGSSELNADVDVSTDFSKRVGAMLSVNADKNNSRVSMVMFQSMMEPSTFGSALEEFQNSIGLTQNNENSFACMVNTVMNPWQTSSTYVTALGEIFRDACFNAYALMYEPAAVHYFAVCGYPQYSEEFGWHFFATMCARFGSITSSDAYHAVVMFSVIQEENVFEIKKMMNEPVGGLFVSNTSPYKLYDLLEEDGRADAGVEFAVHAGLSSATGLKLNLQVVDVVRMQHFKPANDPDVDYPDKHKYLLFGNKQQRFISHIITKQPDFQQVVMVEAMPDMSDEDDELLIWYGIEVTFVDLVVDKANPQTNPLKNANFTYKISFKGHEQEEREMNITLKDNVGWFDNAILNASPKA